MSTQRPRSPVRVLFVAGTGRSGSTLVSNLLGSASGLVSVGELRYLFERGLAERGLCGCGEPVPTCPFWRPVVHRAYGAQPPDLELMHRLDRRLLRLRAFPRLLRGDDDDVRRYRDELARVYRAVAEQAGGDVVVDASKLVAYAHLLGGVDGLDVRVLHLVRDPRGAAHSWRRPRARTDRGAGSGTMGREGLLRSALLWDVWNGAAERLWSGDPRRYVRVRYEDVARDPQAALAGALRLFDLDGVVLPVHGGTAQLATAHTVAGNPNRMRQGAVALRADLAWTRDMPARDRAAVALLTAPWLRRFGYPLRSGAEPADAAGAPSGPPAARVFVEDLRGVARARARIVRNAGWVREQGLRRVLEEKEIDPLRTVASALARARYRRSSTLPPGTALPVFVVGLQRSGTNMLLRGLAASPRLEVHNENDRRAFARYKLRAPERIAGIVTASRHTHVLFKPLCDSHRVDELLDELPTATPPRAVWVYRGVDGRVRSALAKFGDGNRQVLREFATGVDVTRWPVQRMSPDTAELVRSFDYDTMTPATGAALMWIVRNRLFFDLGLQRRADVHLVSYDAFVAEPEATMRRLCGFLGFPYTPALIAQVAARPPTYAGQLDLDPRVRTLCDELAARLAEHVPSSGPAGAPSAGRRGAAPR